MICLVLSQVKFALFLFGTKGDSWSHQSLYVVSKQQQRTYLKSFATQSGSVLTKKAIKKIDSTHVFVVTFHHSGLRYIYFAFLCGTPPSNRICGLCTFKIAHNADWLVVIPFTQHTSSSL